ncbi:MAG: hypothetical protein E6Z71_03325 [Veillonella sp.]|nr:hypothetical protein [Veillonella sp.]MDU5756207.1 hypothetical protein [Veillonella sp.]
MYKPSKKTIYITGAFAAVAGIVGVSSYWNDISYAVCDKIYPEANEGEVRLKDNQGNRYSLLNHGDGKETALYDDNRSVTFHRDTTGNLVWDAGLAGLLPGIAAGYYIFHGFNPPTARMDGRTMTYRVAAPLKPYEEPNVYTTTGSNTHGTLGRRTYKDYEKRRSQKASSIGQKSGFGSAGSRSGGS